MRDKIKLVSSAGTGHYYTTDKNKRTMPDKMEVKKYDPVIRKHVLYKESKIKSMSLLESICKEVHWTLHSIEMITENVLLYRS